MGGAGILPTAIYKGKIYFLLGKESPFEANARGFSDFGGGTDKGETFVDTASREASEESTGFLGTKQEIADFISKPNSLFIDNTLEKHGTYRMFIYPVVYDEQLPLYFNRNAEFLAVKLPKSILKTSKIFEKRELRWVGLHQLNALRPQCRIYFRMMIEKLALIEKQIKSFVNKKKTFATTPSRKTRRRHRRHS